MEKKHEELTQSHAAQLKKLRVSENQEESLTNALRAACCELEEIKRKFEESTELLVMTTMELDQVKTLLAESTTNPNSPTRKADSSIFATRSYNLSGVLEPEAKF